MMRHASRTAPRLALLLAGFALAFAPVLLTGGPAMAQGSGSGSGGGVKTCKAKMANGKTKTWRCQRNQACCVNKSAGTVSCGVPGMGCL